ncbi:MAG: thiamine pyrophosphate-binding protein [Lachnospiraceae bacterium]|nr:thiamine pyrophosphate-binding protein [Lachnospiraceae bacterium]
MIKLSDYVFEYLASTGVKDVFMLSGGGCMHLVNSLGKNKKINYRCCLFEQVVSVAAGAYAQYKNELGVGLVTTGPGGTNAITGVAAAWSDSIPLLMISGQVKTSDISNNTVRTLGFQELDIVSIVKPITKYAVTVKDPENIAYELEKCINIALSGRFGPVWIDIPLDVQAAMIDEDKLKHYSENKESVKPNDETIDKALSLIGSAKRPVIMAGYGVKTSGSVDKLNEFAKALNIPVLLTWKAMDMLECDNDLYMGRPGCIGQRYANFIQQNADLIISLGARLDFGQIGYNHLEFAPNAKKIIVDIDECELNKFKFDTDLSVNVNVKDFLEAVCSGIKKAGTEIPDRKVWLDYCRNLKKKYPVINEENCNAKDGTSTYYLMKCLHELSDENFVFAPGNSGACSEIFCQAYSVKKGQRVVTTNTLGSMGTGIPSAIGSCVASEGKITVCVNGDGGFQMNIQDLETIRRLNLPIKFFVLNNKGYGSIRNSQDNYFDGFYVGAEAGSGVTLPSFKDVARTYKMNYHLIENNDELKDIVSECLKEKGATICELMVSPDERTLPRTKSMVLENGGMKSMPFEDLFPFLDRDEFNENMKISEKE